jgi:malonyl-CoA/methylmalonyl-CoA synthetase
MQQSDEGLFARLKAAMPDGGRAFLRTPDGATFSYADMLARSGQFANCLAATGVRPGDRVAVQVEKSAEALFLYLACLRAGAIYVPINPGCTTAELSHFIADAEPACVVARPAILTSIESRPGIRTTFLTLGDDGRSGLLVECSVAAAEMFRDIPRADNDLAAILYTSGTTGRSKGAMLTQRNLASNALVLRDLWRFSASDVLLHALPIYHTHGLFTAINTIMMAGASMVFLPKFDVDRIFAHLPAATTLMGVPTFYTRMLADPRLSRARVAHMRLFVSGSAPLLSETHRAWLERTGHAILERYGMTETSMIASNPYDGARIAGTVGLPLPGVELRIADPKTGRGRPRGEVGMIELRGPGVFGGYWRKPEQTEQAFREGGYFITGDLGTIDAQGYLRIVGREKDLVISGGLNVYPGEIEVEIDAIAGVAESAVIGVPHPDYGEAVTAIVVPKDDAGLDEGRILCALGARLAKYKLPRRVLFVPALPRNAMGKVQKNVLRQSHRALFHAEASPSS